MMSSRGEKFEISRAIIATRFNELMNLMRMTSNELGEPLEIHLYEIDMSLGYDPEKHQWYSSTLC